MQRTERGKEDGKAIRQDNQKGREWKQYGSLRVRVTFGTASLTELLISYAKGIASLQY